jgi:hypothetical protein
MVFTLAGGPALAGLAATLLVRLPPAPVLLCPPRPPLLLPRLGLEFPALPPPRLALEDWLCEAPWLAACGGAVGIGGQCLSTSLCHLTLA